MFHYLFYFFYSYYDDNKWEGKIPYFSTVVVISVLLMSNYLFIRDFLTYQVNGFKYQTFENENFIVPTIFLGFNYWYFKKDNHSKKY